MKNLSQVKKIILLILKQYAAIGGQAVIEGVMMRSPNAFVVAVRKPDGKIRLRKDQWFGLGKRFNLLRKPILRGVLMLVETMANGIVSLNYSANVALDEEMKKEAMKKGLTEAQYEENKKKNEKVGLSTFLSILASFAFGIVLFVFVPHSLTAWMEDSIGAKWGLQSFEFHAVDGTIKAFIFLMYVWLIGFFPDIRRVFQYHGAEHKSISTFESGLELTVENAKKFPTFHPRCGTTFIFFLLFISIILFAIIFAIVPVGTNQPFLVKHLMAIGFKILLTFPVAGFSYELIKLVGKNVNSWWGKVISYPGKLLQMLTTREPEDDQLEIALASIKAVLHLEETHDLKAQTQKVLSLEEIDIEKAEEIGSSNFELKDFLEN